MINNFQKSEVILFFSITLFFSPALFGQDSLPKPLNVIRDTKTYRQMVSADSNQAMVSLTKMIPGIVLDLRYATTNNFTGRAMYKKGLSYSYLRRPAAKALLAVQRELNTQGYGLKIFDAYRPYSVTVDFWNLIHDERYVANPAKASGHNRGIATDLTIIDLKTGRELDMGTGFDNFTDSAHHSFTQLPATVLANRQLLKSVMEKQGFHLFETEWWHYFWGPAEGFEAMDLDFETLEN